MPWSPKGRRDSGFTALPEISQGSGYDAKLIKAIHQRGGRHSRHGEQHPRARSQKVEAEADKVRSPRRLPYRGVARVGELSLETELGYERAPCLVRLLGFHL